MHNKNKRSYPEPSDTEYRRAHASRSTAVYALHGIMRALLYSAAWVCMAAFFCGACTAADEAEIVTITLPPDLQTPTVQTPAVPAQTAPPSTPPAVTPSPEPTPTQPNYPMKKFKYTPAGYITGYNVNLREGPGTEYAVVIKLDYPEKVTLLAQSGQWYYISAGDTAGFASREFVQIGTLATPSPTPARGNYSDDEIYMTAQMIYLEAKGGTYEEYQAIANVLVNRIKSTAFPNTVEENIFAPGQFTVANNREWFLSKKPGKTALRAAKSVLAEGERPLPGNVRFFRGKSMGTEWNNRVYYATIGNHCFFS